MIKNRGSAQILSTMLAGAEGTGVTKTTIMYKSYLSFNQLKQYLAILQDNGMLTYSETTKLYCTTPKGTAFRNYYDEFASALAPKKKK